MEFLIGLVGALTGGIFLAGTTILLFKYEMKQRAKAAKELQAEFQDLLNSVKGLGKSSPNLGKFN